MFDGDLSRYFFFSPFVPLQPKVLFYKRVDRNCFPVLQVRITFHIKNTHTLVLHMQQGFSAGEDSFYTPHIIT